MIRGIPVSTRETLDHTWTANLEARNAVEDTLVTDETRTALAAHLTVDWNAQRFAEFRVAGRSTWRTQHRLFFCTRPSTTEKQVSKQDKQKRRQGIR